MQGLRERGDSNQDMHFYGTTWLLYGKWSLLGQVGKGEGPQFGYWCPGEGAGGFKPREWGCGGGMPGTCFLTDHDLLLGSTWPFVELSLSSLIMIKPTCLCQNLPPTQAPEPLRDQSLT